jgi:hypothetical protein
MANTVEETGPKEWNHTVRQPSTSDTLKAAALWNLVCRLLRGFHATNKRYIAPPEEEEDENEDLSVVGKEKG